LKHKVLKYKQKHPADFLPGVFVYEMFQEIIVSKKRGI